MASALEKTGAKVTLKKPEEFVAPTEWQANLAETPSLQTAHARAATGPPAAFLAPKQSVTRVARIDKCSRNIFLGKGLPE